MQQKKVVTIRGRRCEILSKPDQGHRASSEMETMTDQLRRGIPIAPKSAKLFK